MSNYSNSGNHPSNQRGRQSKPREQQKTFSELMIEVKGDYFKEIYSDLLSLNECKNIDKVFTETERFAKEVGSSLSTHQLRRVYGEVVKIKNDDVHSLKMLRPHLAYMAARQDKNINGKKVMALLDDLIKQIENKEQLNSFKQFAEALVAYHKFYGQSN